MCPLNICGTTSALLPPFHVPFLRVSFLRFSVSPFLRFSVSPSVRPFRPSLHQNLWGFLHPPRPPPAAIHRLYCPLIVSIHPSQSGVDSARQTMFFGYAYLFEGRRKKRTQERKREGHGGMRRGVVQGGVRSARGEEEWGWLLLLLYSSVLSSKQQQLIM